MPAGRALLPADLLVHFEPWRSQVTSLPSAQWDPLVWDGIAQYYPWRLFASETLRTGAIPLWNPYQFSGTPFLANAQSAVLYPINLLFWLLPVARAFAWSAWLHLVLAGWFAYLFLRRTRLHPTGALAGALLWQGNGFFIAWMHLPTVLCTAAWIPLVLLLLERSLTRGAARRAALAGAAIGLAALAGHPQIFLYLGLLAAAYLLARGLSRDLGLALPIRITRTAVTAAVGGSIAAALAAAQLLPTTALLRIAHRTFEPGPGSYEAYLGNALPALQLTGLILPHPFGHPALTPYLGRGNYAEYAVFIGPLALALALWGALTVRTWHARFFGFTFLVTFLLALGTVLNYPFYHYVPGFARSGGPARLLLLSVFSLAMLAGLGAGRLARTNARRLLPVIFLVLFAAVIIASAAIAAPALATISPDLLPLANREAAHALIFILLALLALATFRRTRARLAPAALALLIGAELLLASAGHLHITPTAWVYPPVHIESPAGARLLPNAADWPINRFPIAVLPPNAATVYHLRDIFGYDSLYLARYRDFAAAVQHGDPSPPLNGNMLLARLGDVYGLDMMSLAGVETVLSPVPVRGLQLVSSEPYDTYRNPFAWPRAWVADSALVAENHLQAVAQLTQLGPLPDTVLITGPADLPAAPVTGSPQAEVHDLSPNRVEVNLTGGGGGYLFLADAYAPGWHASADGHPLSIRPADVAFRVVAPPAGARTVTFTYEPAAFRLGLFAALLALAALAFLGAYSLLIPAPHDP